jgi:ABC-type dipeptide/oligopeptide/nickel transport system permease component
MGTVLVYATLIIVFNLIVDLVHLWLDPRLRDA